MMATLRLPVLGEMVHEAKKALLRFPMVMVTSVLCAIVGILAINVDGNPQLSSQLYRILWTGSLGIPLFLALTLSRERGVVRVFERRGFLACAGVLGLGIYYATFMLQTPQAYWFRTLQLSLGLHLLVSFLPFVRSRHSFWTYNKTLFVRFLLSGFYSIAIFIGVSVALVALQHLFGLSVSDRGYLRLLVLVVFGFNTWIFLAGIPKYFPTIEPEPYPQGLRIFSQFVLTPLVIGYLLILYAYLFKVVFSAHWPQGWTAYLVIGFSVLGVFNLLLLEPLRERPEYAWVRRYFKAFYLAIIPLIGMLSVALYHRVSEYGLTERRSFLAVSAAWLLGLSITFLSRSKKDIRLIPGTLCFLSLVLLTGPWSPYGLSKSSQLGRLKSALMDAGVFVDDDQPLHAPRGEGGVQSSADAQYRVSAALSYLLSMHRAREIEVWFGQPLSASDQHYFDPLRPSLIFGGGEAELLMSRIGLKYLTSPGRLEVSQRFSYVADRSESISVAGFEFACRLDVLTYGAGAHQRTSKCLLAGMSPVGTSQSVSCEFSYEALDQSVWARCGMSAVKFSLSSLLKSLVKNHAPNQTYGGIPQGELVLDGYGEKMRGRIAIQSLIGHVQGDKINPEVIQGMIFLKRSLRTR